MKLLLALLLIPTLALADNDFPPGWNPAQPRSYSPPKTFYDSITARNVAEARAIQQNTEYQRQERIYGGVERVFQDYINRGMPSTYNSYPAPVINMYPNYAMPYGYPAYRR